jgi:hypothetical protein
MARHYMPFNYGPTVPLFAFTVSILQSHLIFSSHAMPIAQ